jgi:hypothetical protein
MIQTESGDYTVFRSIAKEGCFLGDQEAEV